MQAILVRVEKVERRNAYLNGSHTRLASRVIENEKRVAVLEDIQQDRRVFEAAQAEREKVAAANMADILVAVAALRDLNLTGVKEDVNAIKQGNQKLFWLIVAALVTGFATIATTLIITGLTTPGL